MKDRDSKENFILQQGLDAPAEGSCTIQFSALMFQPKVVGSIVLLAVVLQSPAFFLILSAILLWSALLPRLNPFDAVYNRTLGTRPGAVRLSPAPRPRRFAQGLAGSFALAIGVLLALGMSAAAVVFQALLLAAVAALVFGRFCAGSFAYHLASGNFDLAIRALPWKPGASSNPPRPDSQGVPGR